MKPVGWLCRFAVWLIFLGYKPTEPPLKRRKIAYKVVHFFLPDVYIGEQPKAPNGIIIGFNHPTLHEILSLIAWALHHYPERENCFPVNLPWYECLSPVTTKLRRLGVHITPLITQSTHQKIAKICQNDPETMDAADYVRRRFLDRYTSLASEFLAASNNVFVAPSSTRQATIFPDRALYEKSPTTAKLLPTMSYLMYKTKNIDAIFLPITVIPPRRHTRGLNIFRRYRFITGQETTMATARAQARAKNFEHYFLSAIAKNAPANLHYPAAT
jgi:hypothetical protein